MSAVTSYMDPLINVNTNLLKLSAKAARNRSHTDLATTSVSNFRTFFINILCSRMSEILSRRNVEMNPGSSFKVLIQDAG